MTVFVNGDPRTLSEKATVADLVAASGASARNGRGVAVALNGEVVARSQWETTALKEDDRIEILEAIGGG